MEEKEFIAKYKKVTERRNHKIKNSYGVYDAYKWYRKHKPKDKDYILIESQYFAIIRQVNEGLRQSLYEGNDIILPCRMGKIEVKKRDVRMTIEGNKIKTNLPIDWNETLKLWYEDPQCFENKQLVKMNEAELFKVCYNKYSALYENKSFYYFTPNRELKLGLKKLIKEKKFDAFKMK